MKTGRHARILDIIAEHPIETQDELLTRLREEGFKATQATISRDIKDLRLESCCNKKPQRYGTVSFCRTRFCRLSVCCRNNCR